MENNNIKNKLKNILQEIKLKGLYDKGSVPDAPIARQYKIRARLDDIDVENMIITFKTQDFGLQGSRRTHSTQFQLHDQKSKDAWNKAQGLSKIQNNITALRAWMLGFLTKAEVRYFCSCENFLYAGFKFFATKNKDEMEGQKETRPPVKTNPKMKGVACFVGDTKVSLLDGREVEIQNLSTNTPFYVFGCKDDGSVIPTKAISLGITKYVDSLVEVELDSGEKFKCTPEHLIMMRDGTYKEAHRLQENDSIMPLYRKLDKYGYEEFYDNKDFKWIKTHRYSGHNLLPNNSIAKTWEFLKENNKQDKFIVIHHIDFNKRNNNPENLMWMGVQDHIIYHASLASELWKNEEFRKKKTKHNKWLAENKTESQITAISKASKKTMTEFWQDEEFVKRSKIRASKCLTERWRNEEYAEHMKSITKISTARKNSDPEQQKKCKLGVIYQSFDKIKNNNLEITFDNYLKYKSKFSANLKTINKIFGSFKNVIEMYNKKNHKVKSIRFIYEKNVPVYDIEVPETNNFALTAGIFVHNCKHLIGITDPVNLSMFKEQMIRMLQQKLKSQPKKPKKPIGKQFKKKTKDKGKEWIILNVDLTNVDISTWDDIILNDHKKKKKHSH
jgi:hypothetical protein